MLTLLIIFAAIVLSGLVFWFYNRKQVNSLSEQIDDKNAIISAFRNHVEENTDTTSTTPTLTSDLNDEWRGRTNHKKNLTPSLGEVLQERSNKNGNNQKKKSNNQSSNGNKNKQKKKVEQTQQTQKPKKNRTKNNG